MENSQNTPIIKEENQNDKSPVMGFFVGIIVFLLLLIVTGIVLIFTDLGDTVLERIESIKGGDVEEEIEEEEEPVYTLENEGWSYYSIPEYGFSVEIPQTSEYNEEFDQYMRWEISRSKINKYSEDSLEQIHLDYFPSGFSPEARACGQGCNGEMQISVNIYEKNENYNQERIIEQKEQEYNDFVEIHCEIGGPCPKDSFEDSSEYVDIFYDNTWCVEMPYIADGDFRECYFEKGDYLVEIVHTGLDLTDFDLDTRDSELYEILNSMKFE